MDMRKTLKMGMSIPLGDNRRIVIKNVCGYGGTCIVYDADYFDAMDVEHCVRVKECYPCYLLMNRDGAGKIEASSEDKTKFELAKERFKDAYKRNSAFRTSQGLVNSTSNPHELFAYNGTVYSMVTYDEGEVYSKYKDNSLKELLTHMRTIASVIKKYHDNGYLHLDIKPENVLILPETAEHVMLFDFDSVVRQEELGKEDYRISFSDGFSAPEQIRGRISHIGTQTDIFALGALLYYKLFGVKPGVWDCSLSANYDFSKMLFQDNGFQPVLYRGLKRILKKSLATSIHMRWSNVDSFIEKLDDLIELADTDQEFVYDSFSYNSSCFVGRSREISKMRDILEDDQVVFLSGIGGIGKTELARRYAFENRKVYNRVIFCTFVDSIQTMVTGNDIQINHFKRDDTEDDETFFERKFTLLQRLLHKDDLVIVDNFDVEEDENLEVLFEISCKFIVTSREDFRDYNYPQIDVDYMENSEDIFQVFSSYNDTDYSEKSIEAVKEIIELVDRHTMTVELVAKYLRDSDEAPEALYALFLEKEGIMATEDDIRVKNRKDRKLRSKSVNEHLRILFDISGFDEEESELIRSLSLLGPIRISKERFQELCDVSSYNSSLGNLIRRGWIQQNVEKKKIALHQIIMDLVYNDMEPTSENCPHIVKAMTAYLENETENWTAYNVRRKLFELFMERIDGNDIPYAALCVAFGKDKYLPKAKEICEKSKEHIRYDLLQRIYRLEIRKIGSEDIFGLDWEAEIELEVYLRDSFQKMIQLMEESLDAAKKYKKENSYLAETCVEIGHDTDTAINASDLLWVVDEENYTDLENAYGKIMEIYDLALGYIEDADLELDKKIGLVKTVQSFYSEDNVSSLIKTEHIRYPGKVLECKQMIDAFRSQKQSGEEENIVYFGEGSLWEIADRYKQEGEYEKAIELYKKGYEIGEMRYDWSFSCISDIYEEMEDYDNAILYKIKILDHDKKVEAATQSDKDISFLYSFYECSGLVNLLLKLERYEEVEKYAKELVHYSILEFSEREQENSEDDNDYYIRWIIIGYFSLWKIEKDVLVREELFANSIEYFNKMKMEEKLPSELSEFLREYARLCLEEYSDDSIDKVYQVICNMNEIYDEGKKDIQSVAEALLSAVKNDKKYARYSVLAVLKLCNLYSDHGDFRDSNKAMEYAEMAEKIYNDYGMADEYLINLIYKAHADAYFSCEEYDTDRLHELKRKCNYYLLADTEQENVSLEKQLKLWEDAAVEYREIEDYRNQVVCLARYFGLFSAHMDQTYGTEFGGCSYTIPNLIEACFEGGTPEKAIDYTWKYFDLMLEHYFANELSKEEDVSLDETMREFANSIKSFLWMYGQYNFGITFILYMISVCAMLEQEYNRDFYQNTRYYCEKDDDELFQALSYKLDGEISLEQVDFIVESWEAVNSCDAPGEIEKRYKELFEKFLSKYQNQDIEFRHGEG